MSASSDRPAGTVEGILDESPACHLCEDAAAALSEVAADLPIHVRRVQLTSTEGRAIVRAHQAPMPPVVLVDGELLGWGRLSRGKLRARLAPLIPDGAR